MDSEHGNSKSYCYIDNDDVRDALSHKRYFQQNSGNDESGVSDDLAKTVRQVEGKQQQ